MTLTTIYFYFDAIPGDDMYTTSLDVTRGTIPAVPTNRTDVMCLLGAGDVTGKWNRSLVFTGLGGRKIFQTSSQQFQWKTRHDPLPIENLDLLV